MRESPHQDTADAIGMQHVQHGLDVLLVGACAHQQGFKTTPDAPKQEASTFRFRPCTINILR